MNAWRGGVNIIPEFGHTKRSIRLGKMKAVLPDLLLSAGVQNRSCACPAVINNLT
jgi:hypothetical protein